MDNHDRQSGGWDRYSYYPPQNGSSAVFRHTYYSSNRVSELSTIASASDIQRAIGEQIENQILNGQE